MNARLLRIFQFCSFLLDLLSLNLCAALVQLVLPRQPDLQTFPYALLSTYLNITWLFIGQVMYLYNKKYISFFETFSSRTRQAYVYWVLLVMAYLFFSQQYGVSRLYIGALLVTFGGILFFNRCLYLAFRYYLQKYNSVVRKVIIVGYNQTAKKLATYPEEDDRYTQVVGFCEEEQNINELTNYPVLSSVSSVIETSLENGVQEIYSTLPADQYVGFHKMIERANQSCIRVNIIPDLSTYVARPFRVNYVNDLPVLSLRNSDVDDIGNLLRKRLFDVFVSGLVIVFILSWLYPLISLIIWLDSPGPVLFKQQRSGKNNVPFWCLKFRSMKVNSDANSRQASRNDDRFTRVGRFLRKTSLDEFPQFFNVFRGDMSIVGPRPHMLKHTEDYAKIINEYMVRQFLKPGITGWAQVNGYRGETRELAQMQKRVEHDLWYLEHWSLWLDIRIILLTIITAARGDKNAF